MHTAERYHDISCGHRVHGHESKCAHLHGHNYRIHFTCGAEPDAAPPPQQRKFFGKAAAVAEYQTVAGLDELGRVIDFSEIKSKLCMWLEDNWDHKFLIWKDDPDMTALSLMDPVGVVPVPFNPTAENMAAHLVNVVGPAQLLGTGVRLLKVRIEETRKCSATYSAFLGA